MDVKKIRPTAEISFILKTPEPTEVKFVVRPIAFDRLRMISQTSDISELERKLAWEAIVDWNLEEDGQPLACNEDNKARFLEFLFRMRVDEDEQNPVGITILDKLFEFATDQRNFFAR